MKTYIFKVSLPGIPDVWRSIEMRGDQTLEDLHFAIQEAYKFDSDHMYSFFMSGKAWDDETEYSLPEGVDPWSGIDLLEELEEDEEDDEEPEAEDEDISLVEGENEELTDGDEAAFETELAAMLNTLAAMGVPPDTMQAIGDVMRDDSIAPEEKMKRLQDAVRPALGPLAGLLDIFGMEDEEEEEVRDVRETTIDELNLHARKKFMYLFDYGDEWRFDVRVQRVSPSASEGKYPRIVESAGEAPPQYGDLEEDDDEDEDWDEDDVDIDDGEDEGEEGAAG